MTQVFMLAVPDGEKPSDKAIKAQQARMLEGACNADGSWKKGWMPDLLQTFVRHESTGVYRIYHNLDKLTYSVSGGLIKAEGNYQITEMDFISFKFSIKDGDQKPIDLPFRFAISVIE